MNPTGKYLYHSTYYRNLDGIARKGLGPGNRSSNFGGPYAGHSKGKTFVSLGGRAYNWANRIAEHAESKGPEFDSIEENPDLRDEWLEENMDWTVTALRFKWNGVPSLFEDIEDPDDFYWTEDVRIAPRDLEWMNPANGQWSKGLSSSAVNRIAASIGKLLDASLREDPTGWGYDYSEAGEPLSSVGD